VIGIAMDGLGYGADGRLWGGECFVANFRSARRAAHLDYIAMPGQMQAVREPWRMALVYLHRAFGDALFELPLPFVERLNRRDSGALLKMAAAGIQSPLTSSAGRLFDAVASLVGLRDRASYEGQAAMELESIADPSVEVGYDFDSSAPAVRAEPVIRSVVDDLLAGATPSTISAKFHLAVVGLIESLARKLRDERRLRRVTLSGGVFQNRFLLERACSRLERAGFGVYTHKQVPPNDAGICLGQAIIANARLSAGEV
jgi:hydrogenase maturation protein HypF